ncbi:6-phosphogluconate dehydrogenase [Scopulibacillus darangshiensis]|uniref:6-phosphogluconate dehydrogenase n=1 Tax=Scopulibacillus darangshiensis TaxID=442528 RepID=A0A4R2NXU0_9BACL|nr:decarboxylating 6-phosphogluconate dehydrogenase [Scopulibacillus darangshiensis]TCP27043.1 6-phosphogluconate dehydrogenase [Scopulibacillus darangshiensis]
MKLGLIGLGKMGFNLSLNMMDHGHEVVAYDINENAVKDISEKGAKGVHSYSDLIESLDTPRVLWLMIPAGTLIDKVLDDITPLLGEGDIIIEAGNSNYKDTLARYNKLKEKGIYYIDAGTSGGVSGARDGACYMIGGDQKAFSLVEPLFKDTAVEKGYHFTNEPAGGHFLKMVHNGIEYGMMASIAEGFDVLEKSQFDFDYEKVASVWSNGSVIRSWLMELTENAFSKDPKLDQIRGVMNSSGEGKWTVDTALELEVPTPVIALSLMMRYRSQEDDTFTGKVVAALRNEFGGHDIVKK